MTNITENEISTYLAKFVGYTEHAMCSTPPNIAVKGYFEWVMNAAFNLQLSESLDALRR
jgi:hypothetical protein